MGVFLDDGCTIYAPELSKQLEEYLYYNQNGNPDEDLVNGMYATTALNDYYQNDYDCKNDSGDICTAIFENSVDEETCQRMNVSNGSSSYSFTPITFTNWFQYRDPHNYYHLSQADLRDLSSTCSAVNTALSSNRYSFEDILLTLEMENGDTAATLEQYNQEILSPMERLFAMIGAVILAMIGIYCCIATTRRLQRAHRRAKRKQQREQRSPGQTNESKSIIYELGRTLTTGSSDGASSGNGSKQEPLLDDESTDITNSSTKYPIASTSYSYQPRLEQANGNLILQQQQDQSLKIMSIVPQNARSKKPSKPGKAKTPRTKRPFLRWMQFGEKPDEDVFDGISISDSTTYEDPFVGITNDTKRSSDPKEKTDDNDSLFEDVGNN
ncbi:hypothetical protein IV203_032313 [Nitzschia inconspicua]|uniref:Uncharacterized protein n=1 Tax=Nitzschia inconspicua TaxID=303405 RepID=A0A9K3KJH1_9STRA|nr:hypothetical protein IV203_032313 [Nitzschia inconspicua]